jgi:hypothetical protein
MMVDDPLREFRSAVPLPDEAAAAAVLRTVTASPSHDRRRRRRLVQAFAVVAIALLSAAVAFGMGAFQKPKPPFSASAPWVLGVGFPAIRDPHSHRVLARVAQWVNVQGVCYDVPRRDISCVPRSSTGSTVSRDRAGAWGLTFDTRVARAIGIRASGTRVHFVVASFRPPLDVVFFIGTGSNIRTIELFDRRRHKLYTLHPSG